MKKLIVHFYSIDKHKRTQLIVTIGVIITTALGVLIPEYAYASALGGVATNLIWIWE
jgi:hypothetical protein